MANGTAGGAFVDASPRAEIPALIDGEVKVFDSTIILEYLEDKWPTPALLPKAPAERARVRMIEDIMDGLYEPNNWGIMEVTRFKRASGPLADKLVAFAKSQHRATAALARRPARRSHLVQWRCFRLGRYRRARLTSTARPRRLCAGQGVKAGGVVGTSESTRKRGQSDRADEAE